MDFERTIGLIGLMLAPLVLVFSVLVLSGVIKI